MVWGNIHMVHGEAAGHKSTNGIARTHNGPDCANTQDQLGIHIFLLAGRHSARPTHVEWIDELLVSV